MDERTTLSDDEITTLGSEDADWAVVDPDPGDQDTDTDDADTDTDLDDAS
jgi:hypothetical protein